MTRKNQSSYHFIEKIVLDSFGFEEELLAAFLTEESASAKTGKEPEPLGVNYMSYSQTLTELLAGNNSENRVESFTQLCRNFEPIFSSLGKYEELVVEVQDRERFYSSKGEPAGIRVKKLVKRIFLQVDWGFVAAGNLFRKTKKEKQYWEHQVPESALAELLFLNRFLEKFAPVYRQLMDNRENRLRQLYQFDRQLEEYYFLSKSWVDEEEVLDKLSKSIQEDRATLLHFFKTIDAGLAEEFGQSRLKIGTVEFPAGKVKAKVLLNERLRLVRQFDTLREQKQLVFFALAEHWRLKLQNRQLIFGLLGQSDARQREIGRQINDELKPAFIDLKKELLFFTDEVVVDESTLAERTAKIKQVVKDRIPQLLQLLVRSHISSLFDRPLLELEKSIRSIPETHQFAAVVFDGKPVRLKNFRTIKSRQILSGSVLQVLKDKFVADQKKFAVKLQQLDNNLNEIRHVVEYTVDYFLEQANKNDGVNEFSEGLKRAVRKSEDNLVFLSELNDHSDAALQEMCDGFSIRVLQWFEPQKLYHSEKVNQRRAYIAAKKETLRKAWIYTLQLIKKSVRWVKEAYSASNDKYFNLRNLLGISYEKEPISTELSNYLSETSQAVRRLPMMYQKLFENSPLTEERFYLPRKDELKKLSEAYHSWEKGNFAPTCLVGEQGCGATTIFNFFTYSIQQEIKVSHFIIKNNRYTTDSFLEFFRDVFPDFKIENFDDLVNQLNSIPERQVIILENIHNLFIRKNGAYGNLFLLFKLMSQTNRKIFWVCSCFIYSWKLLDYTLNIAGYFAHVVHFEMMPLEVIREGIMKRHRVSGFNLNFLEPEHFSPKRGYQKMDNDEKQSYLMENFFEELWNHAQSNMTLAFVFWLRAIVKVENDTLFIQQKQLSFSFLNSLKTEALTSLHGILIHGGLTVAEHAAVFNSTTEDSARQLMVLDDDGLLEYKNGKYVINPLLYRTLVSQLKSLNFIY